LFEVAKESNGQLRIVANGNEIHGPQTVFPQRQMAPSTNRTAPMDASKFAL